MIPSLYPRFREWSARGSVYLMGDTHFGDTELQAGIPTRPSDEDLVTRINKRVGRNDTFVLLGDCATTDAALAYLAQLHGYKVLIAGNHDQNIERLIPYFDEIYTGPIMVGEKILLSHEPIDVPWAINFHGHRHQKCYEPAHMINCCADIIGYTPISLGQYIKEHGLGAATSIHRITIDKATERKKKRGNS